MTWESAVLLEWIAVPMDIAPEMQSWMLDISLETKKFLSQVDQEFSIEWLEKTNVLESFSRLFYFCLALEIGKCLTLIGHTSEKEGHFAGEQHFILSREYHETIKVWFIKEDNSREKISQLDSITLAQER